MTLDILLLFIFCLFLLPQIILTATTVTPVIQFSDGQIQNPGPTPFSSSTSSSTPHNASSTPSSSSTSSSSIQNASPFTSNKPTKSPEPTKAPTSTSSTFTCKSGTQYGSPITTSLHCDSSKSSHPFSGNDEHYVLGDAGSAFCDGPLEALNPASQVIYGIEIFQPEVWYWDGYWAEGRGLINETTASNLHKQNKFHLTVEALPDCCPGDVYQFYQLDPKKSKTKCMNTFQLAAINCESPGLIPTLLMWLLMDSRRQEQ